MIRAESLRHWDIQIENFRNHYMCRPTITNVVVRCVQDSSIVRVAQRLFLFMSVFVVTRCGAHTMPRFMMCFTLHGTIRQPTPPKHHTMMSLMRSPRGCPIRAQTFFLFLSLCMPVSLLSQSFRFPVVSSLCSQNACSNNGNCASQCAFFFQRERFRRLFWTLWASLWTILVRPSTSSTRTLSERVNACCGWDVSKKL